MGLTRTKFHKLSKGISFALIEALVTEELCFLVREHVLEVAVSRYTIEYPDVEYQYLTMNVLVNKNYHTQSLLHETIYRQRVVACSLD